MNNNLWQTLSGLCKKNRQVHDRVHELYSRISFPYKIRSMFADWIEEQEWDAVDVEDEFGRKRAENIYKELMMKIDSTEERLQREQGFDLEKMLDFVQTKETLKRHFDGNYGTFVSVIRKCLAEERLLVDSCEIDDCEMKRKVKQLKVDGEAAGTQQKLKEVQEQLALLGQKIEDVQKRQAHFRLDYAEKEEKLKLIAAQRSRDRQKELEKVIQDIEREKMKSSMDNYSNRKDMANSLVVTTQNLIEVDKLIWREIEKWLVEQKREITALSKPAEGAIDFLDKMCNEVGDCLIKMVQHLQNALRVCEEIKYSEDPCQNDLQKTLSGIMDGILPEHLKRIFVVERNIPDRVLKVSSGKSLGFSMTLRLLGGNGLGLGFVPPKVAMSLFHEKHIPTGNVFTPGACQILNGQDRTFSLNRGTNSFTANFHSVQLKNVKRPDRGKNEELVTEHKYAFVFYTNVTVLGTPFPLKVVSLPIILTSQTSQEIMAKGTLIWHAAFSEEGKNLFEYKESVPWLEVARVLNALFVENTGRSLTRENLLYLAKMAFRHKESKRAAASDALTEFDAKLISEKQVIRDRFNGREFSFWKWFYACMNLVIHHVKKEWQDGKIHGFISKEDAKRKLKESPCGTFLLRFSESNIENSQKSDICGYLTVAVMEIDPETSLKKLFHVKDYLSPKEIHEKGLAPILDAMEVAEFSDPTKKKRLLLYLWPHDNKKFEDLFGPYIKQKECSDDGYRRGKYSIEIFLTDEQGRRGRQDSVDGSVCDAGSCPASVKSNASVYSPNYEGNEWNVECAPGSLDMNQLWLNMPLNNERPLAAIKPNFVQVAQTQAMGDAPYNQQTAYPMATTEEFVQELDLNQFMSNGQILDDRHLEDMLMTDVDGDLMISSEFTGNYSFDHQ